MNEKSKKASTAVRQGMTKELQANQEFYTEKQNRQIRQTRNG